MRLRTRFHLLQRFVLCGHDSRALARTTHGLLTFFLYRWHCSRCTRRRLDHLEAAIREESRQVDRRTRNGRFRRHDCSRYFDRCRLDNGRRWWRRGLDFRRSNVRGRRCFDRCRLEGNRFFNVRRNGRFLCCKTKLLLYCRSWILDRQRCNRRFSNS